MKILKALLLIAGLALSSSSFAGMNPLVGTWLLVRSDNPMPDGSLVPYCNGVHGMIIYTPDGFVSVALNCGPRARANEPADVSGRKFFYTGTYRIQGRQVIHTVLNSSQPELIGERIGRDVAIRGPTLFLTGMNQGQEFTAIWERVRR